jgi:hypothetical protein
MTYWEGMRLPIRVFWLMHGSINRILAEKDLRALVVAGTQTEDAMKSVRKHLIIEMDGADTCASELLDERDEEGVEELKRLEIIM